MLGFKDVDLLACIRLRKATDDAPQERESPCFWHTEDTHVVLAVAVSASASASATAAAAISTAHLAAAAGTADAAADAAATSVDAGATTTTIAPAATATTATISTASANGAPCCRHSAQPPPRVTGGPVQLDLHASRRHNDGAINLDIRTDTVRPIRVAQRGSARLDARCESRQPCHEPVPNIRPVLQAPVLEVDAQHPRQRVPNPLHCP